MKRSILFLSSIFICLFAVAQQEYEPKMLILSPGETVWDKSLKSAIDAENKQLQKSLRKQTRDDAWVEQQADNIRQMVASEAAYMQKPDFFRQISLISTRHLLSRFYNNFPHLLLLLKDVPSPEKLVELRSLSAQANMQFVLAFPEVTLRQSGGEPGARIRVQLYDQLSDSLLIDQWFEGDWDNKGGRFSCVDKTLNCTLNNALEKALEEVVQAMLRHSPQYQHKLLLQKEREAQLIEKYLQPPFDRKYLKYMISPMDNKIQLAHAYQCLYNKDKTKFVAFFLVKVPPQDLRQLREKGQDREVQIISSGEGSASSFNTEVPQTYAYVVRGIFHNFKWHYEKAYVTYFDSESPEEGRKTYFKRLLDWGFLQEGSTESDPQFWEEKFFPKVESQVEKHAAEIASFEQQQAGKKGRAPLPPSLENYYTEDAKNSAYIGQYELIAKNSQRHKVNENALFQEYVSKHYLHEALMKLMADPASGIKAFHSLEREGYPMIFPDDQGVMLSPVVADYGRERYKLLYFVLIPAAASGYEIYQWTYLEPIKPKWSKQYGGEVVTQLSKLTRWNFSFCTLDDAVFWNEYVLKKEGTHYRYLKPME